MKSIAINLTRIGVNYRLSKNQNTTDIIRGIFEISKHLQLSLQINRENQ